MKKALMFSVLLALTGGVAVAQPEYYENDTVYTMIQYPLDEIDMSTTFLYFNDEWISGATLDMIDTDKITSMKVNNDEYGNKAIFFTLVPGALEELKATVKDKYKDIFIDQDPVCEFPGGNGKMKEWIEQNIRVPESFEGSARVVVGFKVMPDGSVADAKVIKPKDGRKDIEAEALRLVNAMPKFRVKYYTPRRLPLNMCVVVKFRSPGTLIIR